MNLKIVSLLIGAVFFVMLSIYGLWLAVPLMLSGFVRLIPTSLEDRFGQAVVSSIARPGNLCDDPATRRLMETIASRLQTAMPSSPYRFDIQVVRHPEVNALAAPGGHIVVFSGLIDRMQNADQVAAVLAHEMQHVVQRHSMKGLVRAVGLQAFLSLVIGDPGVLGGLAGNLTVLHFMRSDEQSADDAALTTLMRAGIPPREMQKAFENLTKAAGEERENSAIKYLSSHPPLAERIENVRRRSKEWGGVAKPIEAPLSGACRP